MSESAGWDARDSNGRLRGIDQCWDYEPGASVVDEVAEIAARKTVHWPYELAKAYMARVPEKIRDALPVAQRRQPETGEVLRRYAERALGARPGTEVQPYQTMGLLTQAEADQIARSMGVSQLRIGAWDWALAADGIRHIQRRHGPGGIDGGMGQIPVDATDYRLLRFALANGQFESGGRTDNGLPALIVQHVHGNEVHTWVFEIRAGRRMLVLKSARKRPAPAPNVRNASGYEPDGAMLGP